MCSIINFQFLSVLNTLLFPLLIYSQNTNDECGACVRLNLFLVFLFFQSQHHLIFFTIFTELFFCKQYLFLAIGKLFNVLFFFVFFCHSIISNFLYIEQIFASFLVDQRSRQNHNTTQFTIFRATVNKIFVFWSCRTIHQCVKCITRSQHYFYLKIVYYLIW